MAKPKTEVRYHYCDTFNGALDFVREIALHVTVVKTTITAVGGWEIKYWVRVM